MKPLTLEWVEKAENDWSSLNLEMRARKRKNHDAVCFFAQQCIEKYIKACLVEAGIYFKKVHDLTYLLGMAVEAEPLWSAYEREFRLLTDYGVEFRYPGASADLELAKSALKVCKSFRAVARHSLGFND